MVVIGGKLRAMWCSVQWFMILSFVFSEYGDVFIKKIACWNIQHAIDRIISVIEILSLATSDGSVL